MYRGLRVFRALEQQQQARYNNIISRTFAGNSTSSSSRTSSTPTTEKWSTPSTDPGANRKTSEDEGAEKPNTAHDSSVQENKHKKAHQSAAAEKAEKDAKHGASAAPSSSSSSSTSGGSKQQQKQKSGQTASDVHRKHEDYAYRDQGTGSEESVAADRSSKDPLPESKKHSHKHHSGQTDTTANPKTNTTSTSTKSNKI